jgi:hypothetical protein
MVYDAARRETLLFGGVADVPEQTDRYPADLWSWNGESWRRLQPPTGTEQPSGRDVPHLAYDARRERVVMFAGRREVVGQPVELLDDVWEWNGSRWFRISHTGLPKVIHGMTAYDVRRGRVVLFGGYGDNGPLRRVLEFDGARWQARDPPAPEGIEAAGCLVTAAGELVVITRTSIDDHAPVPPGASRTWIRGRSEWTPREIGPASANLQANAGTPDGTLYLFQSWDRWLTVPMMHARSSAGEWTTIRTDVSPGIRSTLAAAYESLRHRYVLYGGRDAGRKYLSDTWEFEGREGAKTSPAP